MLLSLTDVLVVVDKSNTINVFNVEDGHLIIQLDSPSFNITSILHPQNYLNKVILYLEKSLYPKGKCPQGK